MVDIWVFGKVDTRDINDHYTIGPMLGEPGAFGHAKEAVCVKSGQRVAIKIVSKGRLNTSDHKEDLIDSMQKEVEVMRKLQHKHVVKFIDTFESRAELFIVMEYCGGGTLVTAAAKHERYDERAAAALIRQLVLGIQYLHSQHVSHCDIKPDNLVFLSAEENAPLKIIDFGMAKFVQHRKYMHHVAGSPYYVAPEVLNGVYAHHCDMWSVGVLTFVLLFGFPPFNGREAPDVFRAIQLGFNRKRDFPWKCSSYSKDFIANLLLSDPAKRMSAKEALEHAWLDDAYHGAADTPLLTRVVDNLRHFDRRSRLKAKLLGVLADGSLTEREIKELRAVFDKVDADGDGVLTKEELREAMDLHISGVEIQHLIEAADMDGDGCVSYVELLAVAAQRKLTNKEERLWKAFCRFDINGDGMISQEELALALGLEPDAAELAELIKEVDTDGNGEIDYPEFLRMWAVDQEHLWAMSMEGVIRTGETIEAIAATSTGQAVSGPSTTKGTTQTIKTSNSSIEAIAHTSTEPVTGPSTTQITQTTKKSNEAANASAAVQSIATSKPRSNKVSRKKGKAAGKTPATKKDTSSTTCRKGATSGSKQPPKAAAASAGRSPSCAHCCVECGAIVFGVRFIAGYDVYGVNVLCAAQSCGG